MKTSFASESYFSFKFSSGFFCAMTIPFNMIIELSSAIMTATPKPTKIRLVNVSAVSAIYFQWNSQHKTLDYATRHRCAIHVVILLFGLKNNFNVSLK